MRHIVLFILFLGSPLLADLRYSEIVGVVTDLKGTALPKVDAIALKKVGKEFVEVRRAVTDENGKYRFVMLEAGAYDIRFEMTGFSSESTCLLQLLPPKSRRVDFIFAKIEAFYEGHSVCHNYSDIDPTSSTILTIFPHDFMQETAFGNGASKGK